MSDDVKRFTMSEKGGWICRLFLGLLFVLSAILKFRSLESFEIYLFSFDVVNLTVASYLARLLLAFEFAIGLLLISTLWKRQVEIATLVSLLFFSIFLIYLLLKGEEGNCHCMGETFEFSPTESLLKNLLYLLLLFFSTKSLIWQVPQKSLWVAVIIAVSIITPFVKLPVGLRPMKPVGFNQSEFQKFLSKEDDLKKLFEQESSVICIFSVKCSHCKTAMKKMEVVLQRHPETEVRWIVWGDEEGLSGFLKETEVGVRPHVFLSPEKLLPITEYNVPLILFVKNGEVIEKMSNSFFDDERAEECLK